MYRLHIPLSDIIHEIAATRYSYLLCVGVIWQIGSFGAVDLNCFLPLRSAARFLFLFRFRFARVGDDLTARVFERGDDINEMDFRLDPLF